ncbi:MAG: PEP-utilizing enzyme [Candidatus Nanoarchaeia archaeon]|nr:PEP-utilizing enzyme [Candidatus Nanoarchaeia archaeon]
MNKFLEEVRKLDWEEWLERHSSPLVTSLFIDAGRENSFKKIGIPNMEIKAMLYQEGRWYEYGALWETFNKRTNSYLKKHTIFDITNDLDKFYKSKKRRLKILANSKKFSLEQFEEVYDILLVPVSYILLAHALERVYIKRLNEEVPRYVKKDIDKFIGDASFPVKKAAYTLMEEAIRKNVNTKKIIEEFGWLKTRGISDEPFDVKDINKLKAKVNAGTPFKSPEIPKPLRSLFDEVKELVYFRSARTDVLYEFLYLSRSIFKKVSKFYKIPYNDLENYSAQSLVNKKPRKYPSGLNFVFYNGGLFVSDKPIVNSTSIKEKDFVEGRVVYSGKAKGIVKIVRTINDLSKVKEGDVLVAPMTFPSFITAMKKSVAFVTDEGGLTCHAAIVAREMKKPCVVGTKIATKVFKDNDLVEVDAINGIVRKINII